MLLGGSPQTRGEAYWNCSPIAQVEQLRAPVGLIAYRSDTRTPIRQVEQFIHRLDELDKPYEADIIEGGHGTRNIAEMIEHHERLLSFVERYLKDP
jgi:dipeptidyl aminopeptidase/acylaminoacyl peptidase